MPVQPGDVLVTRSKQGLWARLIRAGTDSAWNHVVIASHKDAAGTFWGVEGRPGGVGWVDIKKYLRDPFTLANTKQFRTDSERDLIVKTAQGLLGIDYDWASILGDAAASLLPDLDQLWHAHEFWDDLDVAPGHLVCSSAADWVYQHLSLGSPNRGPATTPHDWAIFILGLS